MLLLFSVATFVVAHASTECPVGTELVATGRTGASRITYKSVATIDECKQFCQGITGCLAFTFVGTYCNAYRYRFAGGYTNPAQVLCAFPAVAECPVGTTQIGERGAIGDGQIGGQYATSVQQCESACRNKGGCKSFNYDPHMDRAYCRLFSGNSEREISVSEGHLTYDQVLCSVAGPPPPPPPLPECPTGSSQIGGAGNFVYGAATRNFYGFTIERCMDDCVNHGNRYTGDECESFEFDNDYNGQGVTRCELFIKRIRQYTRGNAADQIMCSIDNIPQAQSPNLFHLDDVSIIDGNGQTMEVSTYIVYIVIGLICVNILCLMVNCWRNAKRNKRQYKVLSMRSDEETDVESK